MAPASNGTTNNKLAPTLGKEGQLVVGNNSINDYHHYYRLRLFFKILGPI